MFQAATEAFALLLAPEHLLFMMLGVIVGLIMGVVPGMSGMTGMAILLPFVFGMEPVTGVAMLIGMAAVTSTSDTFPSVLLGIPGSSSSQATILDGYPLAQQGQGQRALRASFVASMSGGIIGGLTVFGTIAFARPIVLALGSPELFMLALLGLSMVGILSRGAPLAGMTSGMLGLALGTVGAAPAVHTYRFTFDSIYLYDGIPLPVLALGLFALPEMLDLLTHNAAVSKTVVETADKFAGVRDAIRHKWLVFRSAILGTVLGIVPGIGGSVVDWITYGVTQQTSKNNQTFGHGDIRGVIGVESASNAKDAGTLVPTLLFGIPGSGTTAMLIGGLTLMGIQAGPSMVTTELNVTLSMVWTLVIANVVATALCFGLSGTISRMTEIPGRILVPFLVVILTVAAYQSTRHWGDIVAFLGIGVVAWLMKQIDWPRPPLLVGFVLAVPAERYLHISMSRYGFDWLTFPLVLALGAVVLLVVIGSVVQNSRHRRTLERGER